jgi:prophage regulatory protein
MPPKHLDDRNRSIIDSERVSTRTGPRMVRRTQLREMVPLSDTTIYEMEQRAEFPRRFYLTSRCVCWDLEEVERWIENRRQISLAKVLASRNSRTSGNAKRAR